MARRTVVPFGPQHPVLPEPIHLDLVLEDERVVEAVPSIGFVHRGLEMLAAKKDYQEMVFVAERICGICSFIHGMGYCTGIESMMGIEIPPRATWLRTMWAEMSRIHSHILWAGLFADAFGFESLFMHSWRVRERLLEIMEATTGGRVIFNVCKVGGLRRDVDDETLKRIATGIDELERECRTITDVFLTDPSVRARTAGIGVLDGATAWKLGACGPVLRGSGVAADARQLGYAAYSELQFAPVTCSEGDCWARCTVRVREIYQSFDLIRQVLAKMPPGEVEVKVKPTQKPTGEYAARLEQPRGEVIYYLKGDGSAHLERFRVRTPTFANVPPLVKMLAGCALADVPVIVLTIDPCISCTER